MYLEISILTNESWLDSEKSFTSPSAVVIPIGEPEKKIPSFPEVKTSKSFWISYPSGKYSNIGLKISLDFVYSVYEDKRLDAVCIYYRSKGDETIPKGYKYVKFNDINWEKIKDKALVIMLKRYIENHKDIFVIYVRSFCCASKRQQIWEKKILRFENPCVKNPYIIK